MQYRHHQKNFLEFLEFLGDPVFLVFLVNQFLEFLVFLVNQFLEFLEFLEFLVNQFLEFLEFLVYPEFLEFLEFLVNQFLEFLVYPEFLDALECPACQSVETQKLDLMLRLPFFFPSYCYACASDHLRSMWP